MKKLIIIPLLLLVAGPIRATSVYLPSSAVTELSEASELPILGIGKPKYKKKRLSRQNSVGKTNQRNKGLLRKNGLAQLVRWKEVNLG